MKEHIDVLREWAASLPCGRLCGCAGCKRRAALAAAIDLMERELATNEMTAEIAQAVAKTLEAP